MKQARLVIVSRNINILEPKAIKYAIDNITSGTCKYQRHTDNKAIGYIAFDQGDQIINNQAGSEYSEQCKQ